MINARLASGKNKEEKVVWEPNFVEGFVKGAAALTVLPHCLSGCVVTNSLLTGAGVGPRRS